VFTYFGKFRNHSEGAAMTKFVLAYTGGSVPETEEQQKAVMDAWMNWFGELGQAIVDGGAPFSTSATVGSGGNVSSSGASRLTGYSIVEADSLDAAVAQAKGCPVLTAGGSVEVYETIPM
jgi:hypothetical protein